MRIGYPCMNLSLPARPSRTFRLASYSDARLAATVEGNLAALGALLRWNAGRGLLFHRISSELVPFAAHPVCRYDWRRAFAAQFEEIGKYMRAAGMRAAMHPDQFVLINSPDPGVVARSEAELRWHADLLDAMGMGHEAKIQIHVGGLYGDRAAALDRFAAAFATLPAHVRARLAVENDDRLYPLADCLELHRRTGVPVVFDTFHHALLARGEPLARAAELAAATWGNAHGPPMFDYSSQQPGARRGAHASMLDAGDFRATLSAVAPHRPDLMLEIKEKETAALRALAVVRGFAAADMLESAPS